MALSRRTRLRLGGVLIASSALVGAGAVVGATPAAADAARTRLAQIASAELNNGAHNHEIDECNFYTGQVQSTNPACPSGWGVNEWCANFVEYIWKAGGNIDRRRIDGFAESFKIYGIANRTWHPVGSGYAPQPGDAVVYKDDGDADTRAEHVGMVVANSGGTLTTIEGNVGERVVRRTNPSNIQGFTAPVFGGGEKPEPEPEPAALVGGSKDFTGDGRADVLGRDSGGGLWLYPANATGITYTDRTKVHSGWNIMSWMYAADVDGDERPDVLGRDAGGTLWLYPNVGGAGTGTFGPRVQVHSGWNIMSWMATADVNGDGLVDMIGREHDGEVYVYPGTGATGTGTFGPRFYAGSGWNVMNAMLTADVNGDGRADLLGRDDLGKLWAYPASAGGTFSTRFQVGTGWHIMNGMSTGDANADGRPDLIGRARDGKLWLYPNTGGGGTGMFGGPRIYAGSGWQIITALL